MFEEVCLMIEYFWNYRFGAFEEFKKRNVGPDGNLSAQRKFLCGLG